MENVEENAMEERIGQLWRLCAEAWEDLHAGRHDGDAMETVRGIAVRARACALVDALELVTGERWYYSDPEGGMKRWDGC